jgi:phage/plasmid-like protein (TIGR03299 family)
MSDGLDFLRGRASMFYYGERPWHTLGNPLQNIATAQEAMVAADLDWEAGVCPAYAAFKHEGTQRLVECPNDKAVVRFEDGFVLGMVGNRYAPVQNRDAFTFFDSVVGNKDAKYHTAGAIDHGRKVWILAQLSGDLMVGEKDIVERYILFSNSFDGTSSVRMFYTPVRVVCQNTLMMSLKGGIGQGISIRHTGDIRSKTDAAKAALGIGKVYYDRLGEMAQAMLRRQITRDEVNKLIESAFPKALEVESDNNKELLGEIDYVAAGGRGTLVEGQEGTLWNWSNAVIEVVDHAKVRGTNPYDERSKRFDSMVFGVKAGMKQRVFETAEMILETASA